MHCPKCRLLVMPGEAVRDIEVATSDGVSGIVMHRETGHAACPPYCAQCGHRFTADNGPKTVLFDVFDVADGYDMRRERRDVHAAGCPRA
jgi:hypothetical protein